MSINKEDKLRGIIEKMTVEEKAGQLMVVDFAGVAPTPHLIKIINQYNCAGLRIQPNARIKAVYHHGGLDMDICKQRSFREPIGGCKDLAYEEPAPYCSASQYAEILNGLKEMAMNRKSGIPLHTVFDQEGTGFENFTCGTVRLFPSQMGMAAIENTETVYKSYRAYARQLVAAGLNWIHSPVLDVNTNPKNLEVGVRGFSDKPELVAKYGEIMLKAFQAEKLIATAKHFPGRGESDVDAHLDLPVIGIAREQLMKDHVYPYRKLITEGLPAVMIAHTVYPALDNSDVPATVSYDIITGLLRKELGFKGAITTDNLLMNGLIKKYEIPDAAVRAIRAGATLLLPRAESSLIDEIYHALIKAIKDGSLPEQIVDEAIYYNLSVKYEYGLFENGGIVEPVLADQIQKDREVIALEAAAADESVVVMQDKQNILPLAVGQRVLLIDQVGQTQKNMNNLHCHPGIFWELLLKQSPDVICVETVGKKKLDEETEYRVKRRIEEADIIIGVAYNPHKGSKLNMEVLKKVKDLGKKMILVTNSPYGVPLEFETVVVTFSDATESLRAAAEIIYGKRIAKGKLPVSNHC